MPSNRLKKELVGNFSNDGQEWRPQATPEKTLIHVRAQAAQERLLDMRNLISRDVRTSWLNANTAYQRLAVTQQLLQQANLALDLAQSRYNLGLGSIVELS